MVIVKIIWLLERAKNNGIITMNKIKLIYFLSVKKILILKLK